MTYFQEKIHSSVPLHTLGPFYKKIFYPLQQKSAKILIKTFDKIPFFKSFFYKLSRFFATSLVESPALCKTIFYQCLPRRKQKSLQIHNAPVLLLHGNCSDPSCFTPLIQHLEKAGCQAMAISLSSFGVTPKDQENIEQAISRLCFHHNQKVHVIAHSKGVDAFLSTLLEKSCYRIENWKNDLHVKATQYKTRILQNIQSVHCLGEFVSNKVTYFPEKILLQEFHAKQDIIIKKPLLKTSYSFNDGHLGILFNPSVHRQISSVIQS